MKPQNRRASSYRSNWRLRAWSSGIRLSDQVLVKELRMALDPVAAFMLGIIVGQWLGILLILKVVKAVLSRPSGAAVDSPDLSEQAALIARIFSRELLGTTKPHAKVAKSIPPMAKKTSRTARD
jgi:hypothetical protein